MTKLNAKGAIDLMFIVLLVVVAAVGFFVYTRVVETNDVVNETGVSSEAGSSSKTSPGDDAIEETGEQNAETRTESPEGWATYSRDGISFAHPENLQPRNEAEHSFTVVFEDAISSISFLDKDYDIELDAGPVELGLLTLNTDMTYEELLSSAKDEQYNSEVQELSSNELTGFTYKLNFEGVTQNASILHDGVLYRFSADADNTSLLDEILATIALD